MADVIKRMKGNIKHNLKVISCLRIEMAAVLDNLKNRDLRNNVKRMLEHLKWRAEYLRDKIKAIEKAEKDKRKLKALITALEILNE